MAKNTIRNLGFAAVLPAMALLLTSTVTAQDAGIRSRTGQYRGAPVVATSHSNPAEYDTPQKNMKRLHWLIDNALQRKIALDKALNIFITRFGPRDDWRDRTASGPRYGHAPKRGQRLIDEIARECDDLGNMLANAQDRVHALEGQVAGMDHTIVDLEKSLYDLKCERDELLAENRRLRQQLDHTPRRYNNRRVGNIGGWSFTWGD